ncbi:MAG: hypothetical protein KAX38_00905, partial [Candidatus Krumholzibacteria bacterium]|nr:hypothetical protein [Candidatus Krumholzibacteria bacterium]
AESYSEPMLVIAPDPASARDIEEDLRLFGLDGVVSYPPDEILPYDYHDPDRDLTGLQMKALEALLEGRCRALVCTLRSALKKVFPPGLFKELLVGIRRGEERDPIELAEELTDLGYERHEIVEAKGQFALRGGILDIFEVGEEGPVRMEFDGDEIFSMRNFDIETQRSTCDRDGLRVRPLRHLVLKSDGLRKLRRRIEQDASGMDRKDRARMMLPVERLESGISFFGMEHYAAAVHDVAPIFSYFKSEPLVVYFDAEDLETMAEDFREEIERRYERTRDEGHLYPSPAEAYTTEEELRKLLGESRRLYFRKLGWEGAIRFGSSAPGDYRRNLGGLLKDIKKELDAGMSVFLLCANTFQRDRAEEVLSDVALEVDFPVGGLSIGFRWPEVGVVFL